MKIISKRKFNRLEKRGNYLDTNNGRIWYKKSGKKSDDVDVFIHGLGGTSFPFEKFQKYFKKKNRTTIILDLRGHGFSDKPVDKNYEITEFAQDVLNILAKENITRINLIGHCFGGMISMKIYELRPEIVQTLALISTNHHPDKSMRNIALKEVLATLDEFLPHLSPHLYYNKENTETDYDQFKKESDYYLPRMVQDFEDTSVEVMFHTLESIFSSDFEDTARVISVPTYVIHGKKDSVFHYKIAEKLSDLIPNSVLEIREKDNHVTHIIDPRSDLPQKVYRFISEQSR